MGKYFGTSTDLKTVAHPVLKNLIYVPTDYVFYNNPAGREKIRRTLDWVKNISDSSLWGGTVLDAFAGTGVLGLIYLHYGYKLIAIEKNPLLIVALSKNTNRFLGVRLFLEDNLGILKGIESNSSEIKIIDLDPYGSCLPQIRESARILKSGFLFVTVGDIYRGARFKDWKFTLERYGISFSGPAEDYPRKVIFPFVEKEFGKFNKPVKLIDCFSFTTICRLCIKVN